jgi:hypothetical protein
LELIPTKSFAPTPPARWGEFLRGDTYDFGNSSIHDLDFCSIVVPIDMEQGVALNATGSDSYCYSNSPPWFLTISNQPVYLSVSLSGPVIPIVNPVTAFGSQGNGSPLFPNQPYRFGVYAGGFDESTPAATNAIRISVYAATNFVTGATNVAPINVFTIPLPRRTVSADSNLWTAFMSNGAATTFTTNGLTTTVQFLDNGLTNDEVFDLTWLNGQVITNYILTGYELTHIASSTNYFYKVEVLGKVQVGNSTLNPFATNSAGVWAYTPLYTLDFNQPSPLQSIYMNQLFFQGTPTPPTYADATVTGPAGVNLAVTNQYVLTNNTAYTNLDNSPELRRHPVLDQFVLDMNKDPLALASYVINQIELADPYARPVVPSCRRSLAAALTGAPWEPSSKDAARPLNNAPCWYICCGRRAIRRLTSSQRTTTCSCRRTMSASFGRCRSTAYCIPMAFPSLRTVCCRLIIPGWSPISARTP